MRVVDFEKGSAGNFAAVLDMRKTGDVDCIVAADSSADAVNTAAVVVVAVVVVVQNTVG